MVQRGARYVVLTSRKPDVEPAWLELMQSYGAHIEVMARMRRAENPHTTLCEKFSRPCLLWLAWVTVPWCSMMVCST